MVGWGSVFALLFFFLSAALLRLLCLPVAFVGHAWVCKKLNAQKSKTRFFSCNQPLWVRTIHSAFPYFGTIMKGFFHSCFGTKRPFFRDWNLMECKNRHLTPMECKKPLNETLLCFSMKQMTSNLGLWVMKDRMIVKCFLYLSKLIFYCQSSDEESNWRGGTILIFLFIFYFSTRTCLQHLNY